MERETQQQQRFWQILAEISRPSPAVFPTSSMPKLSLSKFIEGTDDMGAYLETFEATAHAGKWSRNQWAIILRSSLSGAGLTVVASMPADQQQDYATVKSELLREYIISSETYRCRVVETPFSASHPDAWLAKHQQSFHQWLASFPLNMEATLLMEISLSRLS